MFGSYNKSKYSAYTYTKKERYAYGKDKGCKYAKYLQTGWKGAFGEGNSIWTAACAGNVCIKSDPDYDYRCGVRVGSESTGNFIAKCYVYCRDCNIDSVVSCLESGGKTSNCDGSQFYIRNDFNLCREYVWI